MISVKALARRLEARILRCEPPRLLQLTWVFGANPSEADVTEVRVRLSAGGNAWGGALQATGASSAEVAKTVDNTTRAYVPDPSSVQDGDAGC